MSVSIWHCPYIRLPRWNPTEWCEFFSRTPRNVTKPLNICSDFHPRHPLRTQRDRPSVSSRPSCIIVSIAIAVRSPIHGGSPLHLYQWMGRQIATHQSLPSFRCSAKWCSRNTWWCKCQSIFEAYRWAKLSSCPSYGWEALDVWCFACSTHGHDGNMSCGLK